MEPTPTIDTWNQSRDAETLRAFVAKRLANQSLASVELTVDL